MGDGWNIVTQNSAPSAGIAASVDLTSGVVLAANPRRTGAVFVNLSSNRISFGFGRAAVLYGGITLTPNGVWVMDPDTFTTQAIEAIASGAGSALSIQELE